MSAEIIPLGIRFDPAAPEAEKRYDGIVARLNRLSALRLRTQRACAELERQFVENDLTANAGARRGKPLTPRGRRQRLQELLDLNAELRDQAKEWDQLQAQLDRMNRALDAWARKNWGTGANE